MKKPNVCFVFADQHRYQATGFAGDPNVCTPNLDRLSEESINFTTAVSGAPVCSPARASLLTGQYPHRHRVVVNDVRLSGDAVSLAQAFAGAGYDTAYIGKWHLDGAKRSAYIPHEYRQGFDFWRTLGCTHDYNRSYYYADDETEKRMWNGYDATAQSAEAQRYIRGRSGDKPFFMVLSWGPPHNPYDTAPPQYRAMYDPEKLILRPNVPPESEQHARKDLAGYYAHVTALDTEIGNILRTINETGIADNTIFVFWSDHGDMLGSQGQQRKQRPWDESVLVPLLVRYPALFGREGRKISTPVTTPDIMPTLLSLAGITVPDTVDGSDYAPFLLGKAEAPADAALIACYQPFSEYSRERHGAREYRGLRTERYTYVRDLNAPWLLYDNQVDPYQQSNAVNSDEHTHIQAELDSKLSALLHRIGDDFLPGKQYMKNWGYPMDATGAVPYID